MYIFTLPDNSIVGPFTTLETLEDGNYLSDQAILFADQVAGGVISEVPDGYMTPTQQAAANAKFNAEQKKKRQVAYLEESDPLFFKSQREEVSIDEWKNKVSEIVSRYPYR
jgi:hypothetical protein